MLAHTLKVKESAAELSFTGVSPVTLAPHWADRLCCEEHACCFLFQMAISHGNFLSRKKNKHDEKTSKKDKRDGNVN